MNQKWRLIMRAFNKMEAIIKQSPQYGHFIGNVKNKMSLSKSKNEIEKMIEESKIKKESCYE